VMFDIAADGVRGSLGPRTIQWGSRDMATSFFAP
jgi:hypothetical protein